MGNCNNFDINRFDGYDKSDSRDSDQYKSVFNFGCDRRSAWENFESPWRKNDIVTVPASPQSGTDKARPSSGIIYMSNIGSGDFPPGTAVTFNQQPVPIFPILGMSRISASTVRLTLPGEYKVDFFFRPQYSVAAMALFLNDREIPSSRYEALTPSEKLTGTATFVLSPSDVPANLTLRNVHSKNAALNPGTSPNAVDASMTVTAIAY